MTNISKTIADKQLKELGVVVEDSAGIANEGDVLFAKTNGYQEIFPPHKNIISSAFVVSQRTLATNHWSQPRWL